MKMKMLTFVVIGVVALSWGCTSGLTKAEVREIVQEYQMSGPPGEAGPPGQTRNAGTARPTG